MGLPHEEADEKPNYAMENQNATLDRLRRSALSHGSSRDYYLLCQRQGITPEDSSLFEQGSLSTDQISKAVADAIGYSRAKRQAIPAKPAAQPTEIPITPPKYRTIDTLIHEPTIPNSFYIEAALFGNSHDFVARMKPEYLDNGNMKPVTNFSRLHLLFTRFNDHYAPQRPRTEKIVDLSKYSKTGIAKIFTRQYDEAKAIVDIFSEEPEPAPYRKIY